MGKSLGFLAADLGAESGRIMLGRLDGERLGLSEAHRFDSRPVRLPDGLHTDVLRIFAEMKAGMAAAAAEAAGCEMAGVAVDTWGVDFALLDAEGALLGDPYHYRDRLSEGMLEEALRLVPRDEIFARTGVQLMPINTLYQLLGLRQRRSAALAAAQTLLMMPDLFGYWLCGRRCAELTIASTSQCLDPRHREWAVDILERLGLPGRLFTDIVLPGTELGPLLPYVAEEVRLPRLPVIAAGGHDTALAVAAVPACRPGFAYISSGTWSLLGTELPEPRIDSLSLAGNFSNEIGAAGTIRFLKNLSGLWILQECRRHWAREGSSAGYAELVEMASAAAGWRSLIDVDRPEFGPPGDMPARIRAFCARTGQPVPGTTGEVVRCAMDSLALKYRSVLDEMEDILGRRLEPLHVVGGGSRNALLCQLAADATRRTVVAGPAEATAAGNVLMQAMALGRIGSLSDARDVVRRSFEIATYEPRPSAGPEEALGRLQRLAGL
jgi:rhamnulokinase